METNLYCVTNDPHFGGWLPDATRYYLYIMILQGVAASIIINNTQMEKSIATPPSEFLEELQKFQMISCRSAPSKVPTAVQPSNRIPGRRN